MGKEQKNKNYENIGILFFLKQNIKYLYYCIICSPSIFEIIYEPFYIHFSSQYYRSPPSYQATPIIKPPDGCLK